MAPEENGMAKAQIANGERSCRGAMPSERGQQRTPLCIAVARLACQHQREQHNQLQAFAHNERRWEEVGRDLRVAACDGDGEWFPGFGSCAREEYRGPRCRQHALERLARVESSGFPTSSVRYMPTRSERASDDTQSCVEGRDCGAKAALETRKAVLHRD